MKTVLAWIVRKLITILISKNYGKKRNEPIQSRKSKSKRSRHVRIVTGKYRASKMEFKTKEGAEDYIANSIDWDMLVTEPDARDAFRRESGGEHAGKRGLTVSWNAGDDGEVALAETAVYRVVNTRDA